ncbi:YggT family protein [Sulfurimonas sp. SAG-AH-194-C20]|nr:YggT family protein [Sulfurimonas sp. SAG-AH-194-C20]MDF1879375.1 YggT family protein [Sulfurimonas sp. SAG-AH-194-C20]
MQIIIEIVQGVGGILISLISVYIWILIISALLSFVNPDQYNPIVQFLHRITNPAYQFVRKFIRTDFNNLDLAPLVLIVVLQITIVVLGSLLRSL